MTKVSPTVEPQSAPAASRFRKRFWGFSAAAGAMIVGVSGVIAAKAQWLEIWGYLANLYSSPFVVAITFLVVIAVGLLLFGLGQSNRRQSVEAEIGRVRQSAQEQEDELRTRIDELEEIHNEDQERIADLRVNLERVTERGMVVSVHQFDSASLGRRIDLISAALKGARKCILVGVVNDVVNELTEGIYHEFISGGGKFHALFMNPEGDEIMKWEEIERVNQNRAVPIVKGSHARRVRLSIEHLGESFGTYRDERLKVRVYNRQPPISLLMVDGRWALFHYYNIATVGAETPYFEIDARRVTLQQIPPVLKRLSQHFDALWEDPQSWDWEWPADA